jgi:hypothetical protein
MGKPICSNVQLRSTSGGWHANIEGLNMVSAMPFWGTMERWRKQFPGNTYITCTIDIEYLKGKYEQDNSIYCCPDWAAPRKKGRPKKEELQAKSPIEVAMETSKGVKEKRRILVSESDLRGKVKNFDGAVSAV